MSKPRPRSRFRSIAQMESIVDDMKRHKSGLAAVMRVIEKDFPEYKPFFDVVAQKGKTTRQSIHEWAKEEGVSHE